MEGLGFSVWGFRFRVEGGHVFIFLNTPLYGPPNTIILAIGTPHVVPLILRITHVGDL